MKNYLVTLWRYPSEDREENKVNESIFYFNETAENEEQAIKQAKDKFQYSVWQSHVSLESERPIKNILVEHFKTTVETKKQLGWNSVAIQNEFDHARFLDNLYNKYLNMTYGDIETIQRISKKY